MKPSQRVMRLSLAITALWAAGVAGPTSAGADTEEGARKHATKANHLAARNKCKVAIPEFNRAYKTLKDPSLLFNRAECFRKLGKDEEALKDYEQFLTEMPEAPNRVAVQARIASLRGTGGGPDKPETAAAAAKPGPPAAPTAPSAKPVEKAPAAPAKEPAAPAAKPADKPAAAPAKETAPPAKPAEKAQTAPGPARAAKPAEKAPAEPVRRAEKWTD